MIMKRMKDLNKHKDIVSCIVRINIIKMSVFSKLNCRLNAIPSKIPARFMIYYMS